jgi:hypothetical protein
MGGNEIRRVLCGCIGIDSDFGVGDLRASQFLVDEDWCKSAKYACGYDLSKTLQNI